MNKRYDVDSKRHSLFSQFFTFYCDYSASTALLRSLVLLQKFANEAASEIEAIAQSEP